MSENTVVEESEEDPFPEGVTPPAGGGESK